jgi:hypothetical protein
VRDANNYPPLPGIPDAPLIAAVPQSRMGCKKHSDALFAIALYPRASLYQDGIPELP